MENYTTKSILKKLTQDPWTVGYKSEMAILELDLVNCVLRSN